MLDYFIDLKTMGNDIKSPIISVGICAIDMTTGIVPDGWPVNIEISLKSNMAARRIPSAGTILRWLKQSDAARAMFSNNEDTEPLSDALKRVSTYLPITGSVWGNGASFDLGILCDAYALCGMVTPWQSWNECDVRTIVKMGKVIGINVKKDFPLEGIPHRADHDAMHQAKYTSAIWRAVLGAYL